VLNSQRDKVYAERRRALLARDLAPLMLEYAQRTVDDILEVRAGLRRAADVCRQLAMPLLRMAPQLVFQADLLTAPKALMMLYQELAPMPCCLVTWLCASVSLCERAWSWLGMCLPRGVLASIAFSRFSRA
jgi:hypothetical protein